MITFEIMLKDFYKSLLIRGFFILGGNYENIKNETH